MPKPLVARHFRPTSRIGAARIGATGDGLHASESPPPGDVAHVEPKHLLRNMKGFAERGSDSTNILLKMKNQGSLAVGPAESGNRTTACVKEGCRLHNMGFILYIIDIYINIIALSSCFILGPESKLQKPHWQPTIPRCLTFGVRRKNPSLGARPAQMAFPWSV